MNDSKREKIVLAIVLTVVTAIGWCGWKFASGGFDWYFAHWPLVMVISGAAVFLTIVGILVMWGHSVGKSAMLVAGTIVTLTCATAPARAGDPMQYEDYSAYNYVSRAWDWFWGNFTMSDYAQGASTSGQNPSQALPNNFAYGMQDSETKRGGLRSGQGGQPGKFGPKNQ